MMMITQQTVYVVRRRKYQTFERALQAIATDIADGIIGFYCGMKVGARNLTGVHKMYERCNNFTASAIFNHEYQNYRKKLIERAHRRLIRLL